MLFPLFLSRKRVKEKKKIHFWEKKPEEKSKQCYHNDICGWKRYSFSSKVEIRREIVWIKILKMSFENYLIDLIEANDQIKMTSCKAIECQKFQHAFNTTAVAQGAKMLLQCRCEGDVNVQGSCEFNFRGKFKRSLIINNFNRRII